MTTENKITRNQKISKNTKLRNEEIPKNTKNLFKINSTKGLIKKYQEIIKIN